jgi:hypothetical protein
MQMLIAWIISRIEQRLMRVVNKAVAEALQMFPDWWDNGRVQAAEAAAYRLLGLETDDYTIAYAVKVVQDDACKLAIDSRIDRALTEYGQFSNLVIERYRSSFRSDRAQLRSTVEDYGINADALEVYFSKR